MYREEILFRSLPKSSKNIEVTRGTIQKSQYYSLPLLRKQQGIQMLYRDEMKAIWKARINNKDDPTHRSAHSGRIKEGVAGCPGQSSDNSEHYIKLLEDNFAVLRQNRLLDPAAGRCLLSHLKSDQKLAL